MAQSNFAECERDAAGTRLVNVTGNVAIAKLLMGQGVFVVFLSSSAVFDGLEPLPKSGAAPSPGTEYGRQKAEAERQLLELDEGRGHVAIVRLTKAFSFDTPIVRRLLQHLDKGKRFEAFSDLQSY